MGYSSSVKHVARKRIQCGPKHQEKKRLKNNIEIFCIFVQDSYELKMEHQKNFFRP